MSGPSRRLRRSQLAVALVMLGTTGCAATKRAILPAAPPAAGAETAQPAPGERGGDAKLPVPPSSPSDASPHRQVGFEDIEPADSRPDSPEPPPVAIAPSGERRAARITAVDAPRSTPARAAGGSGYKPGQGNSGFDRAPRIAAIDPLHVDFDQMLSAASADPSRAEYTGGPALTLEQLERMAMAGHPAVSAAGARLATLRGRWVQNGLPPNPVAQYTGEEIGAGGVAGMHSIMLGQTYITAGKLGLQQNVVAAEIEQARAELEAARTRVRTDVRTAFVTALVAQQRLRLVEQLREIAEQSVESVETMVRAQEVSRIELLQSQTELQQAELEVENATAELAGARRRLAAVVATDRLADAPLEGDLDDRLSDLQYAQLESETLVASPEVAGRTAQVEQARRALRLACARVTPDITARAGAGYDSGSNDTFAGVQLSVPLPIRDRNQGNIAAARAEIRRAGRELRRTRRRLSHQLAEAFQEYQTARQRRERFREEIIPRAEETLELSVQAFQAGESDYLQLLTVQRTLFQSRLDQLEATGQAARAAARIDGYLLTGSLTAETVSGRELGS